jgi:hypothetical protein
MGSAGSFALSGSVLALAAALWFTATDLRPREYLWAFFKFYNI